MRESSLIWEGGEDLLIANNRSSVHLDLRDVFE